MRAIIIGAGEVGGHLIDALHWEGSNLLVVDQNPAVLSRLAEQYQIPTVLGDVVDPEVRAKLNLTKADLFLAVTSSDETNIIACLLMGQEDVGHPHRPRARHRFGAAAR